MPFTYCHYIPVLKGKMAEFQALHGWRDHAGLTPLIEPTQASPSRFRSRMDEAWYTHRSFMLDGRWLDDDDQPDAEQFRATLSEMSEWLVVPVVASSVSSEYLDVVQDHHAEHSHGVAIRLTAEDFETPEVTSQTVQSLVKRVGVGLAEADVIIDHCHTGSASQAALCALTREWITWLPLPTEWRSLTMVGTSAPESMAALPSEEWSFMPRKEWLAWTSLLDGPSVARKPAFGDYAANKPDLPPTGYATVLAKLCYSTPGHFMIWKGKPTRSHGFEQFNAICRDLVGRSEYRGPDFSPGDALIQEKATAPGSPGNATTWLQIATSHHIGTVLDQIANLPGA